MRSKHCGAWPVWSFRSFPLRGAIAMALVSAWLRIPFWQRVLAGFALGALAGWLMGALAAQWFEPLGRCVRQPDQDDRDPAGVRSR
jgi:membrane protein YqaA with SNARE-associated domain